MGKQLQKRQRRQSRAGDSVVKDPDPSETGKHAPLVRIIPKQMALLIKCGFQDGFYVPPFKGEGCLFSDNLKSVQLNLDVVRHKLVSEVREGRMAVPF